MEKTGIGLALVLTALTGACDRGPAAAYERFALALERGDMRAAYPMIDQKLQGRLQEAARRARELTEGAFSPRPDDLLIRPVAPTQRVVRVEVVAEDQRGALLKVQMEDGSNFSVEMARDQAGGWHVVLEPRESPRASR